jgi:hypothetical protein
MEGLQVFIRKKLKAYSCLIPVKVIYEARVQISRFCFYAPVRREGWLHRVGRVLSFSQVVGIGTPPTPHPQASMALPGSEGRGTLAGERGVGRVPIPTRGHTLWYSLYIYTYYVVVFVVFCLWTEICGWLCSSLWPVQESRTGYVLIRRLVLSCSI